MADMQKPFQTPEASEEEPSDELRTSELVMLGLLALIAAVGLWMFLNPKPSNVEEAPGSAFGQQDDGHVFEFSDPDGVSPQQSIADAQERRRMAELHAPEAPERPPTYGMTKDMEEAQELYDETGFGELFKDGNIPDFNEIDMRNHMPDRVREVPGATDQSVEIIEQRLAR